MSDSKPSGWQPDWGVLGGILIAIPCLIDTPISLASDTLYLPKDLYRVVCPYRTTLSFLGEDRLPLEGVIVKGREHHAYKEFERVSDAKGCVVLKSGFNTSFELLARRPGYYAHELRTGFSSTSRHEIVMRRILNPVPMTKRSVETKVPKLDEPCGFDLQIGDWVHPYGVGRSADMTITGSLRDGTYARRRDIICNVAFRDGDGVIAFAPVGQETPHTVLCPLRGAPPEGYKAAITVSCVRDRFGISGASQNLETLFLFRVRASASQTGDRPAGNVGWFDTPIQFVELKANALYLRTAYYFNDASGSLSLEPAQIADMQ